MFDLRYENRDADCHCCRHDRQGSAAARERRERGAGISGQSQPQELTDETDGFIAESGDRPDLG